MGQTLGFLRILFDLVLEKKAGNTAGNTGGRRDRKKGEGRRDRWKGEKIQKGEERRDRRKGEGILGRATWEVKFKFDRVLRVLVLK